MEVPLSELASHPRFTEAAGAALDLAIALLGPPSIVISCVDDEGVVVVCQHGASRERLYNGQRIFRNDPLGDLILSIGKDPVVVEDVQNLPGPSDAPDTMSGGFVGVPITLSDGRRFGAISILGPLSEPQADVVVTHLNSLAHLLACAIDVERFSGSDAVTGLQSRTLFDDHLALELARSRRSGAHLAVIVVSFDPPHERQAGDHRRWLKKVGERLRTSVRQGDTVARIGTSEFALLVPDLRDLGSARRVAQSLLDSLDDPYHSGDDVFSVTSSIGVAMVPWDGYDPDTLLLRAASAMGTARSSGGSTFHFYSEHRYLRVIPWE
ncbi:MAG TPA: GGDEF domain-containing protein [Thermomicrobiales bacterium]|nr:GGDEF domain-containing protein [Thermomicrobiales bacterium]